MVEEKKIDKEEKREEKTDLKYFVIIGLVGIVLAAVIIQSFQINAVRKDMKNQITANAVGGINAGGGIDMSGWTENEKMMYEHHGTLPARASSGTSASPSSGMVGGC